MLRSTLYAFVVYVFGAVGLLYWSVAGFNAGAASEDWALMLVLPAAWIISFWPMFGTAMMVWKVRGAQDLLQRIVDRLRDEGAADTTNLADLEELAVQLAAHENRLPQFLVRRIIRRAIRTIADDQENAANVRIAPGE